MLVLGLSSGSGLATTDCTRDGYRQAEGKGRAIVARTELDETSPRGNVPNLIGLRPPRGG